MRDAHSALLAALRIRTFCAICGKRLNRRKGFWELRWKWGRCSGNNGRACSKKCLQAMVAKTKEPKRV